MKQRYHHGDLRHAVLAAASDVITKEGLGQLSLRSIAAELGVSHTAPRHHFGTREGVINALAVEGFDLLADALEAAADTGSFADVGVAYAEFALNHPGHFTVMFTPHALDLDDPDLRRAQDRAAAVLHSGAAERADVGEDAAVAAIAAWSLMHGLATLVLTGNLDVGGLRSTAGGDPSVIARRVADKLFAPMSPDSKET